MNFISVQKKCKFLFSAVLVLIVFFNLSIKVFANSEAIEFGENGEYGSIYGAEYDPENGDTSKWLTIQPNGIGVRIVGDNNQDIFRVDKYGGVYVNGKLYVNNEEYISTHPGMFTPNNGFMYMLVIVSLGLNGYLLLKRR